MEFTKSTSFKIYPLVKNKLYLSHPLTSEKPNIKVQSELVSLRKKKVKEQKGGKKRSSSHLIKDRSGWYWNATTPKRWKVQQFGGASRTPALPPVPPALHSGRWNILSSHKGLLWSGWYWNATTPKNFSRSQPEWAGPVGGPKIWRASKAFDWGLYWPLQIWGPSTCPVRWTNSSSKRWNKRSCNEPTWQAKLFNTPLERIYLDVQILGPSTGPAECSVRWTNDGRNEAALDLLGKQNHLPRCWRGSVVGRWLVAHHSSRRCHCSAAAAAVAASLLVLMAGSALSRCVWRHALP